LAILSRLSRFSSPAVGTNWPFCVDVPLKHQSINQSILFNIMNYLYCDMCHNCLVVLLHTGGLTRIHLLCAICRSYERIKPFKLIQKSTAFLKKNCNLLRYSLQTIRTLNMNSAKLSYLFTLDTNCVREGWSPDKQRFEFRWRYRWSSLKFIWI